MKTIGDLTDAQEPVYEVVSPLGDVTVKTIPVSSNLDTLDGKTICELSVDMYSYDISFPVIREALQQRYTGLKIISHTEFPEITMMPPGPEYQKYVENQVAMLKQKGCNAVILGNGG